MPPESVKRVVAQKVSISDVLSGKYVKEEGWGSNYVVSGYKKISRVNLMAVVLSKPEQTESNQYSFLLDDGTGKISVRGFEENKGAEGLEIGDIVLLIGKIREYNQERYVLPEIIKKNIDMGWVEVRKLELKKINIGRKHVVGETYVQEIKENVVKEEPGVISSSQMVCELIKKMDTGDGVDFDDVINNSKLNNAEELISNLLQEGEIFELKPGKLKVLE